MLNRLAHELLGWSIILTILAALASCVRASDPASAVVKFPSHGGSGTVIHAEPGRSLVLSCAHMFFPYKHPQTGEMVDPTKKTLSIEAPHPAPGSPKQVRIKLLKKNDAADLSLIEVAEQLPYVCPVAPADFQPGQCLSVGYDEMAKQAVRDGARIIQRAQWITDKAPWHGRSGGALIDQATGQLVGVVTGYECDRIPYPQDSPQYKAFVLKNKHGVYSDLDTIRAFLDGREAAPTNPPMASAPRPGTPAPAPRSAPGYPRSPLSGGRPLFPLTGRPGVRDYATPCPT